MCTPKGFRIISFKVRTAVARICIRKTLPLESRGSARHFVSLKKQESPVLTAAAHCCLLPPLLSHHARNRSGKKMSCLTFPTWIRAEVQLCILLSAVPAAYLQQRGGMPGCMGPLWVGGCSFKSFASKHLCLLHTLLAEAAEDGMYISYRSPSSLLAYDKSIG